MEQNKPTAGFQLQCDVSQAYHIALIKGYFQFLTLLNGRHHMQVCLVPCFIDIPSLSAPTLMNGRRTTLQVCRLATGKSTRLPLLSPSALRQYERSKSAAAAAIAAAAAAAYPALAAASSSSALPVANGAGSWLAVVTAPRAFLARQRQRLRRLKRRIAAAGGAENGYRTTPLGAGGARVWWVLPPPPPAASKSRRHGSRAGGPGESMATPTGAGKHLRGRGDLWRLASGGDTAAVSPVEGEASPAAAAAAARGGVVGHVWVSLKLRDPSMLMMRVVRQWNMARDEASVQQRRAAQLEAKR